MRKLLRGVVDFRQTQLEDYRNSFGHLASGQNPDTLFIACSDSRVVPNVFASTNPGDLFVIRNVGNIVPPCCASHTSQSECASIEFAVSILTVTDIIICGHSECGAMKALLGTPQNPPHELRRWLAHAEPALDTLRRGGAGHGPLKDYDLLSQINALEQVRHISEYPLVRERVDQGLLRLHAWWFDLAHADVYTYDDSRARFVIIDESVATSILDRLEPR